MYTIYGTILMVTSPTFKQQLIGNSRTIPVFKFCNESESVKV